MPPDHLHRSLRRFAVWYRLSRSWSFLQVIAVAWAGLFALLLLLDKVIFIRLDAPFVALIGSMVALVAWLAYFLGQPRRGRTVAYLVDHQAGLKNLVASALDCTAGRDDVSHLVVARAESALAQLQPHRLFPFRVNRIGRYLWVPLLVLLVAWFLPAFNLGGRRAAFTQRQAEQQAVNRGALKLKDQVEQLTHADKDTQSISGKQITQDLKDLTSKLESVDKKDALMAIGEFENKYRKDFDNQRQFEDMARKLEQHAIDEQGLSEAAKNELKQLTDALKNNDLKQAAEAMHKLAEQMGDKQASSEQQQALAREMQKLVQNMPSSALPKGLNKHLAQMQEQAKNDGDKQGDKQGKPGGKPGDKQDGSPSDQPGDSKQAQQQAQQEMNQLAQQMDEMNQMQDLQKGLADAKKEMVGDNYSGFDEKSTEDMMRQEASLGEGEGQMPGEGQGQGQGQGKGKGKGNGPGQGGEGHGQGAPAQENKTATTFKSELTNSKINQGKIVNQTFVYGVPEKGEALEEYINTVQAAKQDATSALSRSKVPREYEDMVKNYFDTIGNQGKQ